MSTSNNSNQQTLADLEANERPPMLERGNYIPWESRFRTAENINGTVKQILEPLSKMTGGNKKQYIFDVKVMNYLLQAIPNDIYNSMDACKIAKEMWERIKRLMFGSDVTSHLQGDSQEDKLTTVMMLLARAITQKFSTPTNNRLHTSSNTRNQAMIQDGRVDIQTKNAGYGGNAMKDEAGSNLNSEENDFMLDTSFGEETVEELTAVVMLMARIQPADGNSKTVPSYDAKDVSEVNASSKVHEQMRHEKCKTIIQTSDDDQIDSNIIFDDSYVENNGGMSDHDSNDHDEYHKIQMLAYDVQREAKNKK
ncbi:hypothetical protein Tco_0145916 [Tanacetum coccineum]